MIEQKSKDELIKLVEGSDLDSTSESYLIHKINLNRITGNEELEKEISIERRKTELRKIVENTDLSYTPKSILFYKIQQNFILSEYELNKEIAVEKRKAEPVNEIESKRKRDLIKIVEETNLSSASKSVLTNKIIKQIIITEEELKIEITKELEMKKEEKISMPIEKTEIRKNNSSYNSKPKYFDMDGEYEEEYELDEEEVPQEEDEDLETWEKTKEFDNYILDSRFDSKDDYGYGDVDYENDRD